MSTIKIHGKITDLEKETLSLIADGLTNKEIARRYDVSVAAIQNRICSLLYKFNALRRTDLVVKAMRVGLLSVLMLCQIPMDDNKFRTAARRPGRRETEIHLTVMG